LVEADNEDEGVFHAVDYTAWPRSRTTSKLSSTSNALLQMAFFQRQPLQGDDCQ
jgi:hypothetical protein